MLSEQELENFFSHIDEISQDSASTDQFQQIQKLKNENNRLKIVLNKLRSSTREVLEIVKNERQQKLNIFQDLERTTAELEKLRNSYDELDKSNVNNQFKYKENLDELEIKHQQEHTDYIELAKDYFNVLSEATTFYNFEIKRDRNKILGRTSSFLENALGDKFQKPRLVVKRSSSTSSDTKSTASKRSRSCKEKTQIAKRKKLNIWEMKSISEASSPMSFHEDLTEEITQSESEYSFKTFSIGNETSFSSLMSKKVIKSAQCKCHIVTRDPDLVSIGVNTDESEFELPRCMPSFNDDDIDFDQNDFISSTVNNCNSQSKDLPKVPESDASSSPKEIENISPEAPKSPAKKKVETKSIGTSTDIVETTKQMKDQSTSICVEKCSKATSTVHSVTHRGTMTPGKVTRNVGIQFPEITLEKILEEMSFDLPHCISPILEEIVDNPVPNPSKETQTDIHNVSREVDYVVSIKAENSDERKTLSNEEQSFIVLGQTVFNLFMNRLRETNKSLTDDAHTRQRLREQLLDRFDEFTFDDYFSPCFVSSDSQENVLRRVFEDVRDTKIQKKSNYEQSAQINNDCGDSTESENILLEPITEIDNICMDLNAVSSEEDITKQLSVESEENQVSEIVKQRHKIISDLDISSESSQEDIRDLEKATGNKEIAMNVEEPIDVPTMPSKDPKEAVKLLDDLAISGENLQEDMSVEKEPETQEISKSTSLVNHSMCSDDNNDLKIRQLTENLMETDEIMSNIELLCSLPRKLISPIDDLTDLIWSSVFPENESQNEQENSPIDDEKVLDGYDIEHEPAEIPIFADDGIESPFSPPIVSIITEPSYDPVEIPLGCESNLRKNSVHGQTLEFDSKIRYKLVTWQQSHQLDKINDKRLCKIRKSIKIYLDSDWTDENLENCLGEISNRSDQLLLEAIFETVEDNKWQKEINSEFTPPAPPLPRYQQKLILLISKLAQTHPDLPHQLVNDLEMKLFKCENSSADLCYLRNVSYYYSSLIDLFFEGDPTIVFYFIIKCIYFYGHKAIPMVYVLIKAFPLALPKKSMLLKKYSTNIDWERMTGAEMSKVRLDLEWMDSLELCVMYFLTNIQVYRRKGQEFKVIYEHEFFNYLPKMYGFQLTFITAPKMLDVLVKRLEDGMTENLSMSFILLGKRMNKDFTVKSLLKEKLIPLLKKYVDASINAIVTDQKLIDKICILIESISTILKPLTEEKDKIFNEIFPLIVNILGRSSNQKVEEYCIKAILRLQRFIENHKEIYEIIKSHFEKRNLFSESLRHAIVTFVHRKKEAYFKE